MGERLTIAEEKLSGVEGYWKSGGRLDKYSLDKAVSTLSQPIGKKYRAESSFLAQVEVMGRFSEISITYEQQYLYMVLRDFTKETKVVSDSSLSPPGTVPVWTLIDQQLMAEVLRLTDKTSLPKFMRAYPHIFDDKAAGPQI